MTELRILGWQSQGLRCPDHQVSFEKSGGGVYQISLIQMANGTGKTTTFKLLRAALSGAASEWDGSEIDAYRKDAESSEGSFEVSLLSGKNRFTFHLEFDFAHKRARYHTTKPGRGKNSGFEPPRELARFFRPELTNCYIFDGEYAADLLDPGKTNAQAVIENLFQVSLLRTMKVAAEQHWEEEVGKKAKTFKGFNTANNKLKNIQERLKHVKLRRAAAEEELEDAKKRQLELKRSWDEQIKRDKSRSDEHAKVGVLVEGLEGKVRERAGAILREMRMPYALSEEIEKQCHQLHDCLDRVKLPESAAREFFQELAEEAECVCGRPLGAQEKDAIQARASRYMGSDDVGVLNALKQEVTSGTPGEIGEAQGQLANLVDSLKDVVGIRGEKQTELEALKLELEQRNPEAEKVSEQIVALQAKIRESMAEQEQYDAKEDSAKKVDHIKSIAVLEGMETEASEKLAQVTDTLFLKERKELLGEVLDDACDSAQRALSSQIKEETNQLCGDMLPYNDIVIEDIDRCLHLVNKSGGSVGETLSVSYAFLTTLFNRAEHKLPLIVDSPTGSLDGFVRPEIAKALPKLGNQLIAFMIDTEKPEFLPYLQDACDDLQYVTLVNRKHEALMSIMEGLDDKKESPDGRWSEDRAFFEQYKNK